MDTPTVEECKEMDLETAKSHLVNAVYEAAHILERLEYAGKVSGNGHHMRQQVADFAEQLLTVRWNNN